MVLKMSLGWFRKTVSENTQLVSERSFSQAYHPGLIPYTLYRPSPGINRAPIARMKMILIPIECLYKNLQLQSVKPDKPSEIGL